MAFNKGDYVSYNTLEGSVITSVCDITPNGSIKVSCDPDRLFNKIGQEIHHIPLPYIEALTEEQRRRYEARIKEERKTHSSVLTRG